MPQKRRVPDTVLAHLEHSLKRAKLETFSPPTAIDEDTLAYVKLYLDSWCVPNLELVIAWAKGEASTPNWRP